MKYLIEYMCIVFSTELNTVKQVLKSHISFIIKVQSKWMEEMPQNSKRNTAQTTHIYYIGHYNITIEM